MERKLEVIQSLLQNVKIRIAGAFSAIFLIVSGLSAMNSAADNALSVWARIESIWAYLATPWLGLFVLFLITYLVVTGMKEVAEAHRLGSVEDHQKWSEETRIRQEVACAHNSVLEFYARRLALERFDSTVAQLEARFRQHSQFFDELVSNEEIELTYYTEVECFTSQTIFRIDLEPDRFFHLNIPIWEPNWNDCHKFLTTVSLGDYGYPNRIFRREDNEKFVEGATKNRNIVRKQIDDLKATSSAARGELRREEVAFWERMRADGQGI